METKKKKDLFSVIITADKMEAFLELKKTGIEMSEEEVNSILKEIENKGILLNCSLEEIKEKISISTGLDKVMLAKGTPPEDGRDGYCEIHYQQNKDSKPAVLEDGKADFYNLEFVINVNEGDVIATIYPPTEGKDGVSVTGEPIPYKPGKNAKVPMGKNVKYEEENMRLIAAISGKLSITDNQINVYDVLEIKNVDFKTGNIDFVGSVVVDEGVKNGFTIRADGDVTVKGYVDSSSIICGGNLVVNGGIQGRNKGSVQAEGNVIARYIENCEVKSSGSVVVKDAIMHSKVYAHDKIVASEGKGLIVGGIIGAGKEIVANTLGSHLATKTELEVGVNPDLREKLQSLTKDLATKGDDLKKAKQAQRLLKAKEEQLGQLPQKQHSMLIRLNITIKHLSRVIEEQKSEQQKMLEELMTSSEGRIKVNKLVYSGVKITIGTRYRNITDNLNSPTFIVGADGEITFA